MSQAVTLRLSANTLEMRGAVHQSTDLLLNPSNTASSYLIITYSRQTDSPPPQGRFFFPVSDMSDQPGSSRLRALFKVALRDYEATTNLTLANHPLAEQLENCHSVESVTSLLQYQVQAMREFPGSGRMMKSIESTVSVLHKLSAIDALGVTIGLVRQNMLIEMFRFSDIVL